MLGVKREQFGRRPAERVRLGAETVAEIDGGLTYRRPAGRDEIPARRDVRRQVLDSAAPQGGGVGEHGGCETGSHPTGYGKRDRWAMRPEAGLPCTGEGGLAPTHRRSDKPGPPCGRSHERRTPLPPLRTGCAGRQRRRAVRRELCPAGRVGTTSADDLSAGIPSRRFVRSRAGAIRPGLAPASVATLDDRTCEAKIAGVWRQISVAEAGSALVMAPTRCPSCPSASVLSGSYAANGNRKFSHRRVHTGCPRDPKRYSGTPSPYPRARI